MLQDQLMTALKNCQDPDTDELLPFIRNLNQVLSSKGKKLLVQDEDPKKQFPQSFQRFMGVQMNFNKIAMDKDLSGTDHRVFHYILANMDQNNILRASQEKIGEELGLRQPNVARSIKKFKDKDVIQYKGSKRSGYYVLNPEIAWKGKTSDWYDLVKIGKLMSQNATFINSRNTEEGYTRNQEAQDDCPV